MTEIPSHRRAEEPPRHAVSEELRDGKLSVIPDTPPPPAPAANTVFTTKTPRHEEDKPR